MTSIGNCMLFITVFSFIFNGLCKLFLHKGPLTLLKMDLSFLKSEDHQLRGDLLSLSFHEAMNTSQSCSWANRMLSSFPKLYVSHSIFSFFSNHFNFFSQNDGSLTIYLKVFLWFELSLIRCFLLNLINIAITSKFLTNKKKVWFKIYFPLHEKVSNSTLKSHIKYCSSRLYGHITFMLCFIKYWWNTKTSLCRF